MPGPVRDLLVGVDVRAAGRRRKCGRNSSHQIVKGELCLVVKRQGRGERAYCKSCAAAVLDHAESRIENVRAALFDAD